MGETAQAAAPAVDAGCGGTRRRRSNAEGGKFALARPACNLFTVQCRCFVTLARSQARAAVELRQSWSGRKRSRAPASAAGNCTLLGPRLLTQVRGCIALYDRPSSASQRQAGQHPGYEAPHSFRGLERGKRARQRDRPGIQCEY